jgi:hypothetical protein
MNIIRATVRFKIQAGAAVLTCMQHQSPVCLGLRGIRWAQRPYCSLKTGAGWSYASAIEQHAMGASIQRARRQSTDRDPEPVWMWWRKEGTCTVGSRTLLLVASLINYWYMNALVQLFFSFSVSMFSVKKYLRQDLGRCLEFVRGFLCWLQFR